VPYRLRYKAWIDYLPPGISAMAGTTFNASSQGNPITATTGPTSGASVAEAPAGGAQTVAFFQTPPGQALIGTGAAQPGGNSLASADITTLLTAMTTDLSTQMNAALARLAQFPNGGT
jgi:hypothetical protein